MRPPTGEEALKDAARSRSWTPSVFTPARDSHSSDYEAAMRAADAVFTRRGPRLRD